MRVRRTRVGVLWACHDGCREHAGLTPSALDNVRLGLWLLRAHTGHGVSCEFLGQIITIEECGSLGFSVVAVADELGTRAQ